MNRIDDYKGFSGWDPEAESYLEDADCAGTGEKGAPENTCCAGLSRRRNWYRMRSCGGKRLLFQMRSDIRWSMI